MYVPNSKEKTCHDISAPAGQIDHLFIDTEKIIALSGNVQEKPAGAPVVALLTT